MPTEKNQRVFQTQYPDLIGTVTERVASQLKVRWDDLTGGWYRTQELMPLAPGLKVAVSPSLDCLSDPACPGLFPPHAPLSPLLAG
jgi:hypothetical protein